MSAGCCDDKSDELVLLRNQQRRVLWLVLAINAVLFVAEFTVGWIVQSGEPLARCDRRRRHLGPVPAHRIRSHPRRTSGTPIDRQRNVGNQRGSADVSFGMKTSAKILAALVLVLLTLTACGSDVDPDDGVILLMEDISGPVNEQNIQEARHFFDVGRERWDSYDPFPYVLTVGLATVSEVRIEFDADGNVIAEEVVEGDPEGFEVTSLPRTVDEVFDTVDRMIRGFEDGTTPVPDEDECGHHFGAHFDTDLGVPSYYDALGPCDDGVGVEVSVTRIIEN